MPMSFCLRGCLKSPGGSRLTVRGLGSAQLFGNWNGVNRESHIKELRLRRSPGVSASNKRT